MTQNARSAVPSVRLDPAGSDTTAKPRGCAGSAQGRPGQQGLAELDGGQDGTGHRRLAARGHGQGDEYGPVRLGAGAPGEV